MKWKLIILLFVLFTNALSSQVGFKNLYDFGGISTDFYDMIIENDTIYAFGSIISPETFQKGLLFATIDTNGIVLSSKIHYDSLGAIFTFTEHHEVIKTSDGGYAAVGTVVNRSSALIIKLDKNGELEFQKEYVDTSVFTIRHRNLIETSFGYISIGSKQQKDDFKNDGFALAFDFEGELMWEFEFGDSGTHDTFTDIKEKNGNYLIGTEISNGGTGNNNYDLWYRYVFLEIDSNGDLKNEVSSPQEFLDGHLSYPTKWVYDSDGNYIQYAYRSTVFSNSEEIHLPSIVSRDKDLNLNWETNFYALPETNNFLRAINNTNDGGYITVGMNQRLVNSNEYYQASFIAKVNEKGDSLWTRLDTLGFEAIRPLFVSVDDLSSGSIVACGEVIPPPSFPTTSLAYLMKVNKNGCLLDDCPLINGNNELDLLSKINCYPNPASDFLIIQSEIPVDYQIYNELGQVLLKGKAQNGRININDLKTGRFFIRFSNGNSTMTKLIVKDLKQ